MGLPVMITMICYVILYGNTCSSYEATIRFLQAVS